MISWVTMFALVLALPCLALIGLLVLGYLCDRGRRHDLDEDHD